MNPRYLLDTNVLSDLVRNPQGVVSERIAEIGETAVCTSIIVAAELRFGARKRGSKRLTTQVETILSAMTICPLEEPADHRYARLRAELAPYPLKHRHFGNARLTPGRPEVDEYHSSAPVSQRCAPASQ